MNSTTSWDNKTARLHPYEDSVFRLAQWLINAVMTDRAGRNARPSNRLWWLGCSCPVGWSTTGRSAMRRTVAVPMKVPAYTVAAEAIGEKLYVVGGDDSRYPLATLGIVHRRVHPVRATPSETRTTIRSAPRASHDTALGTSPGGLGLTVVSAVR